MSENTATPAPGLDKALEATADHKTYATMGARDIVRDTREAPLEIWGGLTCTPGEIMEIIGPSGLGKSRLVLNLAINHILGRPFAGLETRPKNDAKESKAAPADKKPLTWLFHGNENSFFRFRNDLTKMFSVLNDAEQELIGDHLFLPTMETPEDCYISFESEENRNKLLATIIERDASVVVMDPWGAVIDGDELSDQDVRHTINEISAILRKCSVKLQHPVMGIILNHSRNGIKEMINACGPNAANYGKNSKAVFTVVRVVWNLRKGAIEEPCNKIELINAKGNDFELYAPVCVELNQDTMSYNVDTTFNHDVHQALLEKMERTHSQMTPMDRSAANEKAEEDSKQKMLDYLDKQKEPMYKTTFDEWGKTELKLNEKKRQKLYNELVAKGKVSSATERKSGGKKVIWTTEKMLEFLQKAPDSYKPEGGGKVASD